jgi:hypothetical protein
MKRLITIALIVPATFACQAETVQEEQAAATTQAVELRPSRNFNEWVQEAPGVRQPLVIPDSVRALADTLAALDRGARRQMLQQDRIQKLLSPDLHPALVPITVRNRSPKEISVAGKRFPSVARQQRFRTPQSPTPPEIFTSSERGKIHFEVDGKLVGMQAIAAPESPLPEGNLERIHVDVVGNEVIVIGYYSEIASGAALDAQSVKCVRCIGSRVCVVNPEC